MNEKNLEYLKDSLKYMGFGESLGEALEKSMAEGKAEFTLSLDREIDRKAFNATLYFRKGDSSEVYFFNKWDATLKNEVGKTGQTFYVNKGHGITLKEGFNLLEGRAVHKELSGKEGQSYKAWLVLDKNTLDTSGNYKVQQYHQNYGYDLEKTLAAFPIKELSSEEQKAGLLRSLERGNLQAVTFEKNGFMEKLFIEAAPRFKSINAYDHAGKPIPVKELEQRFDFSRAQAGEVTPLGKARGKVNNHEVEKGEPTQGMAKKPIPTEARKSSLLPQKSGEESLLPKKKEATGKGLHP